MILFGIFIISNVYLSTALTEAQHGTGEGYDPGYVSSISVGDHYIKITQEEVNTLKVEELIWYKNNADSVFTDHIFVWAQPGDILEKLNQFGVVIDGSYIPADVFPSSQSPNFLFMNLSRENLTIDPGEALQVVYSYTLNYTSENDLVFYKILLYSNSNVIVIIDPDVGFKAEGTEGLELIFDEKTGNYATSHTEPSSLEQSATISILFSKAADAATDDDNGSLTGQPGDYTNYILLILVVCAVLTIFVRFRKKSDKKSRRNH